MKSLRTKLTISYTFIALSIIIVISIMANSMLDKLFMKYALNKQEKQVTQIISQINQLYDEKTGQYNLTSLEIIGNAALQNGLILHITTLKGEIHWDIRQDNYGQCQLTLLHAEDNMHSIYPDFKGSYSERSYQITGNNGAVGLVYVGYYGPYSFNDEEIYLIKTANKILILIAIISLILAMVLGFYMAKRITMPIFNVIRTAKEISQGKFGIKATSNSRTKEISELVISINELSNKLNNMENLKKRLTSDVAHELRTPLSHLLSHTEAMIDGVWIPNQDRLKGFYDEIERIAKIVNDLQGLANIEEDQQTLRKECINASNFLHAIKSIFQIEIDKKHIKVDIDCPENEYIYADKDRLKQILNNIVSNAVKYTPAHGEINIKIYSQNNSSQIYICDNGCGISPQDLPYIFERFYRADKSRTRLTGGSGIGLAIAKSLVLAHSGKISVISEIGKGTTFKLVLPLNEASNL